MVQALYIEFKNLNNVFVYNKLDNNSINNSNVVINSYDSSGKIIRIVFIRFRLILNILIITITTILDIVILVLNIVKHILDIVTPWIFDNFLF